MTAPPADLIDWRDDERLMAVAEALRLAAGHQRRTPDHWAEMWTQWGYDGDRWIRMARAVLAALTEWATGPDGTVALIDPATWTRWDRDDVKLGDEAHVTVANARAAGRYLTKGEIVLLTPRED